MNITSAMLTSKLLEIAKENAPARNIVDRKGRPLQRAVGKRGTNMYSPYPGNLKNNGIYRVKNGVVFDYNKVGYIGYANLRSRKPQYLEKTIKEFCDYLVALGGRIKQQ